MANKERIDAAYKLARERFVEQGVTTAEERIKKLDRLETVLRRRQDDILAALRADLNKCPHEAFMTEVGIVLSEIRYIKKHLKRWLKPKRVRPALAQLPGKTRIYHDPYGVVLVMSPWNYPFMLTLNPVLGALAGGNTVLVKPSAYSPHTAEIIKSLFSEAFEEGDVQTITGGRAENEALLDHAFDYIFFTGSPTVGKVVMEAAAKHLTPITLELGGKSPAIVDKTASIEMTAKRLLFGKLLNAGQTCIAPDHVLCQREIKDDLLQALKKQTKALFSDQAYIDRYWPKIINEHHFERLAGLLEGQMIVTGGELNRETKQMGLAIIDEPTWDSAVMQEEVFGPILPVLSYDSLDQLINEQKARPKPLALYLFTNDDVVKDRVLSELSFGGGCVNDAVMHISSSRAPFGGVGNSGMGHYHGRYSFETFTHEKAVLHKSRFFDVPLRHHPYKKPEKTFSEFLLK